MLIVCFFVTVPLILPQPANAYGEGGLWVGAYGLELLYKGGIALFDFVSSSFRENNNTGLSNNKTIEAKSLLGEKETKGSISEIQNKINTTETNLKKE